MLNSRMLRFANKQLHPLSVIIYRIVVETTKKNVVTAETELENTRAN